MHRGTRTILEIVLGIRLNDADWLNNADRVTKKRALLNNGFHGITTIAD